MGNEDPNYKREEDRAWRESVSTRLVSLTDSEVTQNDRLDEIDEELKVIKQILEGKSSDRDDNGLKGDIHDLSVNVNELRRLMMPDHLGQGGMIARLKALERKAGIEEHDLDNRWKFKTAVAIAIISAIVAILTNLDRIEPPLKKLFGVHSEISTKSRKSSGKMSKKRRHPAGAIEAPREEPDDSTAAPLP